MVTRLFLEILWKDDIAIFLHRNYSKFANNEDFDLRMILISWCHVLHNWLHACDALCAVFTTATTTVNLSTIVVVAEDETDAMTVEWAIDGPGMGRATARAVVWGWPLTPPILIWLVIVNLKIEQKTATEWRDRQQAKQQQQKAFLARWFFNAHVDMTHVFMFMSFPY